jgi:hypothetical protein
VSPAEGIDPTDMGRMRFRTGVRTVHDDYGEWATETWTKSQDGPMVSSKTNSQRSGFSGNPAIHYPMFDIDAPAALVPSSTEGHFHLYLSTPTTWRRYKKAMKAMAKAGMIDYEWWELAKRRKQAVLRRQDADSCET